MLPVVRKNRSNMFNDLFNEFLGNSNYFPILDFNRYISQSLCNFASDLEETDFQYILTIDLPSIQKDDIKISYNEFNRVLHIEANTSYENESNETKYIWKERKIASMQRDFIIPSSVDSSSIKAEMKDGILIVKLDKTNAKSDILQIEVM